MTTYFAHRKHLLATRFDDFEDDEVDEEQHRHGTSDMPNEAFEIPLQTGRAFGLEMILRKQRTSKVFGCSPIRSNGSSATAAVSGY